MNLRINAKDEKIAEGTTVAQLLVARDVDPGGVVVEINLDIVPKESYNERMLAEGDTVEILHFVGGG